MLIFANLRLLCSLAVLSLFAMPGIAAETAIKGDPEALERMYRMLDNLGGRETWASARSLYTMEKARSSSHGDGIIATFWRDLEHPAEKVELKHPDLDVVYAWDESGGWISRNGDYREFVDDEIGEKVFLWHREIHTLYHQLATGEIPLTLKTLNPDGFRGLPQYQAIRRKCITTEAETRMAWRGSQSGL